MQTKAERIVETDRTKFHQWTCREVCCWLHTLGFDPEFTAELEEHFTEEMIDGESLTILGVEDLIKLGFTTETHRRSFLTALTALQSP